MALIICQNCQQRLEIPTGLGTIHVTCPTCGRSWDHRVEYIIEIKEATGDLTFYRDGDIHETSADKATRFPDYYAAAKQTHRILGDTVLHEPVEIRIVPAPDDTPWTFEEIMAREG